MTLDDMLTALRELLDGAEAEGRDLNEDEAERAADLNAQIAAVRERQEIRSQAQDLVSAKRNDLHVYAGAAPKADDTEERAFESFLRTGQANMDIAHLRAQGEGTPSAGGYLVPDGFRQKLQERMLAFGGLQGAVETLTTESGNPLQWPTVDDTSNQGEIVAENGTFASGADVTFGTADLGAYKYMAGGAGNAPLKVSVELLQDSAFDVRSYLARALGTRIARLQATHWVNGTGVGQPKGLVHGVTGVEIAADTAGVTYADLVEFVHSVDPEYRANAAWAFNDTSLAYIRTLEDTNGRPLLSMADDSVEGGMGGARLLGFPVVIDQAFNDIDVDNNSQNWGAFGDLRAGYVIRRVRDVQIVVLNELYAANGQVGFMAWSRADGVPQDSNAYIALTGEQ